MRCPVMKDPLSRRRRRRRRKRALTPEGQMTFSVCLEQDGDSGLVLSTFLCSVMVLWRGWCGSSRRQGHLFKVLLSATDLMASRSKPAFLTSLFILLLEAASQALTAQRRKLAMVTYQQRLPLKNGGIRSRNVLKEEKNRRALC